MAAAGSATLTEIKHNPVKKIKFVWTSSAGGAVSGGAALTTETNWCGKIVGFVTVPNGGGTAPTSYTATVVDADGVDVLLGAGATRSATVTEMVASASLGIVAASTLELVIAGAGNAKGGTAYLYIQ